MAGKIPGASRLPKQDCANRTEICVPTGWNGKSGIARKIARLFRKISGRTALPFAFKPVELEICLHGKRPGCYFCRIVSVPFNNVAVLQPRSLGREFNGFKVFRNSFSEAIPTVFNRLKLIFPVTIAIRHNIFTSKWLQSKVGLVVKILWRSLKQIEKYRCGLR